MRIFAKLASQASRICSYVYKENMFLYIYVCIMSVHFHCIYGWFHGFFIPPSVNSLSSQLAGLILVCVVIFLLCLFTDLHGDGGPTANMNKERDQNNEKLCQRSLKFQLSRN